MQCEKCNGDMVKMGEMHSGNSIYEIKECKECFHKVTKCKGLS